MSTGKSLELRAEHEVRYTWDGTCFVTAMSRTSGVAKGFYGLVVGVSGPKITCLAVRSPANRTGNHPPKQAVRPAPINGRELRGWPQVFSRVCRPM